MSIARNQWPPFGSDEPDDDFSLIGLSAFELVDHLDVAYPHRCILPNESPESAHRYAGLRMLIDELKQLKDEDEQSIRDS